MDAGLSEDDPLSDIADVVADSLEILGNVHQFKRAAAVARILGNHIDDGGLRVLVKSVNLVIARNYASRKVDIVLDKGHDAVRDHLGSLVCLSDDVRDLNSLAAAYAVNDVCGGNADSVQVGRELERGGDEAEVRCDRLLGQDKPDAGVLNFPLLGVKLYGKRVNMLLGVVILTLDCLQRGENGLLAQLAHPGDVLIELSELAVIILSQHD